VQQKQIYTTIGHSNNTALDCKANTTIAAKLGYTIENKQSTVAEF